MNNASRPVVGEIGQCWSVLTNRQRSRKGSFKWVINCCCSAPTTATTAAAAESALKWAPVIDVVSSLNSDGARRLPLLNGRWSHRSASDRPLTAYHCPPHCSITSNTHPPPPSALLNTLHALYTHAHMGNPVLFSVFCSLTALSMWHCCCRRRRRCFTTSPHHAVCGYCFPDWVFLSLSVCAGRETNSVCLGW